MSMFYVLCLVEKALSSHSNGSHMIFSKTAYEQYLAGVG